MISSQSHQGVENVNATRRFGCTSSGKAYFSDFDIAGGDIPTDKTVRVKCILMVESANEAFLNVVSRYTITGKI